MRHTFYNKALAATLILTAGLAAGPFKADAQWRTDIPADFSLTGTYSGDTGTRTLSAAYTANSEQDNNGPAEQPAEIWSLHDCMRYAVANSPKMRVQQATNDDRRIDRREAAFGFLPTISAGTSGSFSFGRGIDPETNVYTNTTTFSNSYSLSAEMDIFNGFSAVNSLRIAKTALLLGIEEEQVTKDDICL